jgi:hypothetical protein
VRLTEKRLLEYEAVLQEAVETYDAAGRLKSGEAMEWPACRVRVGKRLYEVDAHRLKRLE